MEGGVAQCYTEFISRQRIKPRYVYSPELIQNHVTSDKLELEISVNPHHTLSYPLSEEETSLYPPFCKY